MSCFIGMVSVCVFVCACACSYFYQCCMQVCELLVSLSLHTLSLIYTTDSEMVFAVFTFVFGFMNEVSVFIVFQCLLFFNKLFSTSNFSISQLISKNLYWHAFCSKSMYLSRVTALGK